MFFSSNGSFRYVIPQETGNDFIVVAGVRYEVFRDEVGYHCYKDNVKYQVV